MYIYLIDVIVVKRIVRLFLSTFSAKNTKPTVSSLSCSRGVKTVALAASRPPGGTVDVSLLLICLLVFALSFNPCRVYHSTLSVFCFFLRYYLRLVSCFLSRSAARMSFWLARFGRPEAHPKRGRLRSLIYGYGLYGVLVIYTCLVRA